VQYRCESPVFVDGCRCREHARALRPSRELLQRRPLLLALRRRVANRVYPLELCLAAATGSLAAAQPGTMSAVTSDADPAVKTSATFLSGAFDSHQLLPIILAP